jgi:phosphohistidine phosphatase SixA
LRDHPLLLHRPFSQGTVQGKNPNFSVTLRRVFTTAPAPLYRTFFLIRHGESKWNEAQSKINITGMLDRDHPLTEDGINQACALNARWRLAKSQGKTKYSEAAPNMRASMCSELIDFTKLGEDDLVAMGGGDADEGSGDEGEDDGDREKNNRLGKLYDTFFQRYSNVTAAGKPRQPTNGSAPGTPTTAATPPPAASAAKGTGNASLLFSVVPNLHPMRWSLSTAGPGRGSFVPSFLDSEILDFTTSDSPAHSRSSSAVPPSAAVANLLDLDDAPAPPPSSANLAQRPMPPIPVLPAVTDPFDLLDGYTDLTISSNSAGNANANGNGEAADDRSDGGTDSGGEENGGDDDLPQRREEYVRLFMRADIVYVSPLTRAVQTALAAMCGHQALAQRKLTLYRSVGRVARIAFF